MTHLYNAQRRWAPRDPGIAGVALTRPDVIVQVIPDGVHLAKETVLAALLAARGRFGVVTDAISAAGMAPGRHALGDREVIVTETDARLADGTLAGSVLHLDQAVRNLVDLGVPLSEAVGAASAVPARLLGRADLGSLRPGVPADLAVLDDRLQVRHTVVAGEEIFASTP